MLSTNKIIIYKISSMIENETDFFIGMSKTSEYNAMYIHRVKAKKNNEKKHNKLYNFINRLGFENIKCEVIELIECNNKDEEQNALYNSIMKYQPTLNTKEKRVIDMKEYQKNYRSKNKNLMDKEKRAQYNKKYSEKRKLQSLLKSEQNTQQYLTIDSF